MAQIKFNTGRPYSKRGQRIIATLHDDGIITFHDVDRMIDGELPKGFGTLDKADVMYAYDHNLCKNTQRSWQDAFSVDGCNSKWED